MDSIFLWCSCVEFKDAQSARLCVDIIDLVVLTTVLALVAPLVLLDIISNCGIP